MTPPNPEDVATRKRRRRRAAGAGESGLAGAPRGHYVRDSPCGLQGPCVALCQPHQDDCAAAAEEVPGSGGAQGSVIDLCADFGRKDITIDALLTV